MGLLMQKIEISEIENSYLNFFTPAMVIATGYFLYNVFIYPLLILQWLSYEDNPNFGIDFFDLWNLIIPNISCLFIVFFVLYILMPKLNVLDASFKGIKKNGFVITLAVFFLIVSFRIWMTFVFDEILDVDTTLTIPWYLRSYSQLSITLYLVLYFTYRLILRPLFHELVFRRTAIPLLEDRGLSPFHAVVLTSIGYCLLLIPNFFEYPDQLGNIYWILSTFLFGLGTGIVYILTRNVGFSILYSSLYYLYRMSGTIGFHLQNELETIFDIANILILIAGISTLIFIFWDQLHDKITQKYINKLKIVSVPNIRKGIIGFSILSVVLVLFQYFVSEIIDVLTFDSIANTQIYPDIFILYTLFYLIVFSIPFWLSITSEYAQS